MNRPTPNYDYSRAGVVAVTLKCRKGIRLCRITQDSFTLLPLGKIVQTDLLGIPGYYPQIKIGQYQIMPDHVHVIVHVVQDLPKGVTLQRVIRGFKIGANRHCTEDVANFSGPLFQEGMFDRPIFSEQMLASEVNYIRTNVRRYRLKKEKTELFNKPRVVLEGKLERFGKLWGLGDISLLDAPRKVQIRCSRKLEEEEWPNIRDGLWRDIKQNAVFVSPFISPFEKRSLKFVLAQGARVIQVTNAFLGERYKPIGFLFDAFCEGRVLVVSVAGEFRRYKQLDWAMCQRLNEVAGEIALMKGT